MSVSVGVDAPEGPAEVAAVKDLILVPAMGLDPVASAVVIVTTGTLASEVVPADKDSATDLSVDDYIVEGVGGDPGLHPGET